MYGPLIIIDAHSLFIGCNKDGGEFWAHLEGFNKDGPPAGLQRVEGPSITHLAWNDAVVAGLTWRGCREGDR